MYAVFKFGGRQHRATVGDIVKVQRSAGDVGQTLEIVDVLMVKRDEDALIGAPLVDGAKILAEIVSHGRDKKVMVQKFKRRKKYRRYRGHRQHFTKIKLTDLVVPEGQE